MAATRKFKPNKSMKKRFGVTATGKLKRRHTLTSHLRSNRSSKKKRHLGRPALVAEGFAKNLRRAMGVTISPGKLEAKRNAARAEAKAEAAATTTETK
ncbi:MAG TPA: 50S ribosomal protein L35 [Tepidisphaeraceae bacterium]|nr:50S ribosomal protein L35 [Tepidisphaeraceae bacterium]